MTDTRYRRQAGGVYSLKYHRVGCPQYRLPVLTGEVAEDLLKGFTSWMPSLWSRSDWVGSIGQVSEATNKRSIAEQKDRH
jgi:REP element-mobilizing transposase RayT